VPPLQETCGPIKDNCERHLGSYIRRSAAADGGHNLGAVRLTSAEQLPNPEHIAQASALHSLRVRRRRHGNPQFGGLMTQDTAPANEHALHARLACDVRECRSPERLAQEGAALN
jgi:hypothetical protein